MLINIHPHQIVMILGTVLSIIVLVVGWPRRKAIGGLFFVAFSMAITEWQIASITESFVVAQNLKILWSQISYIGFVQAVPYLFLFTITYIRQRRIRLSMILSVMVIPALTLVFAWTNSLHGWVWSSYSQGSIENNVLIYHHGFWFWVHAIFLYTLLVVGIFVLLRNISKSPPAFRRQLLVILAGVVFPVVTGTAYILGLQPVPGMDITPTGMAFTGLFLAWGLIKYQILDLLPVARAVLVEQLQDGVIVLDLSGRIVDINLAAQKLLGWDPKTIIGQEIGHYFPMMSELLYATDRPSRRVIPLPDSPGVILEAQCSTLFSQAHLEVGKLLVFRDVTSRNMVETDLQNANIQLKEQLNKIKKLQKKLEDQALHDSLTGLYNRHIDEILEKEISRAKRESTVISMVMIDIDHFKSINDKYGHQYGDFLLRVFSQFISKSIRKEDYAARFGGDEILLAFPGMNQISALKKAEEIRVNFEKLVIQDGYHEVHATITIGVATYPQNGQTVDEVLRSADRALYAAKAAGRNQVKADQPAMLL